MARIIPWIAIISGGFILLKNIPQILSGNINIGNSGTGQLIGIAVGAVLLVGGLYSLPDK